MLLMTPLDVAFEWFPHPSPFDHTTLCGTCNGTGAAQCKSQDCVHRCVSEGKQCFKPSRYKLGCCCDPAKIPAPNEFKCRVSAADSSSCKWECCQAVHYGQRTVSGTLCGEGCCSPSDHGGLHKCGRSLYVTTTGSREACCMPDGAAQDRQTHARCCIHGAGVNCTSPRRNDSCCLLESTKQKRTGSSDPHAACQRLSCKAFVPCPGETGVLCSSLDRKVCCLKDREPSVHDPCQRSRQDCDGGGRYVPCGSSDALGIDCSSRSGTSVCCLPGGRETRECRRLDCSSFRRERLRGAIVLPLAAIALLLCACRRRLKSLWQRWRASLASGGRGGQLLLPSGSVLLASPLIIHPRRIVLNITCQRYLHYDELGTAYRDGDELRDVFYHLAYDHVVLASAGGGSLRQEEVLGQLPVPQSVDTFSANVAEGLKAATAGAQRLWRREVCSADFQRVCLGRLPSSGRRASSGISTASSSSLLPESSSAPEVTRPSGA